MGTEREEGRNGNVRGEREVGEDEGKWREGEDQCQSTSYAPVSDYIGRAYYLFICIRTCWNGHIRQEQP